MCWEIDGGGGGAIYPISGCDLYVIIITSYKAECSVRAIGIIGLSGTDSDQPIQLSFDMAVWYSTFIYVNQSSNGVRLRIFLVGKRQGRAPLILHNGIQCKT